MSWAFRSLSAICPRPPPGRKCDLQAWCQTCSSRAHLRRYTHKRWWLFLGIRPTVRVLLLIWMLQIQQSTHLWLFGKFRASFSIPCRGIRHKLRPDHRSLPSIRRTPDFHQIAIQFHQSSLDRAQNLSLSTIVAWPIFRRRDLRHRFSRPANRQFFVRC